MAKKNKKQATALTFRQRLREDAKEQLAKIWTQTNLAVGDIALAHGLRPADLAKLLSDGEHKTLHNDMVTTLANNKEAEIEKLYNTQQGLGLGDDNGDS